MDEFADEFGDDVLNELLGHDLDALEQSAVEVTQASKTENRLPPRSQEFYGSQNDYESFQNGDDDDEIIDTSRTEYAAAPVALPAPAQLRLPAYRPPSRHASAAPLNGQAHENASRPTGSRAPLQRTQSALAYRLGSQAFRPAQITHQGPQHHANLGAATLLEGTENEAILALRAQVQELLQDKQNLQTAVQEANKRVLTKSGEIAIVRSNFDKSVQEKQQRYTELERELVAVNERHKAELDDLLKQQEQVTTENRFADHDKVLDKARRRKQPAKPHEDVILRRPIQKPASRGLTPRKERHVSPGDGFSVAERSPSKPLSQAQQLTPRAAERKRKRLPESPIKPLSLHDENEAMNGDDDGLTMQDAFAEHTPAPSLQDGRYESLQRFVNRRKGTEKRRILEVFAGQSFPSDPESPLSTLIYDEIGKLQSKSDAQQYSAALCGVVTALWTRALTEKYLAPLTYFSDLILYMLRHNPEAITAILDDIIPLLQKTADNNLIPRFKRSLRKVAGDPGTESEHVDATDCLEILVEVASMCDDDRDLLDRFWTMIRVDFLSMLLRPAQNIKDVILTCRLLTFGIRPDGFGPVLAEGESQSANGGFSKHRAEDHLADRISALLIEIPRSTSEDAPASQPELAALRQEVLALMEALSQSHHSGSILTQQTSAVGRLVRCMNEEFHQGMAMFFGWEDRMKIVNQATRLLYHFVYHYASSMDINEKLRAIPGGAHKYLIVLTRLAFSEGTVWGVEIDEDTVDCAQELLEDHVNPEEGEALMAAFQSGHSKK